MSNKIEEVTRWKKNKISRIADENSTTKNTSTLKNTRFIKKIATTPSFPIVKWRY